MGAMHNVNSFAASIMSDVEAQEHYDRFFEDVFLEMEEKVKPDMFINNVQ